MGSSIVLWLESVLILNEKLVWANEWDGLRRCFKECFLSVLFMFLMRIINLLVSRLVPSQVVLEVITNCLQEDVVSEGIL